MELKGEQISLVQLGAVALGGKAVRISPAARPRILASREAIDLLARCEAIFLDPTYTAKAMAGLIAYVPQQRVVENQTVLFWHTGGQVALFA